MRNVILAWYAYSESGEAGRTALPQPHRLAELIDDPVDADLDRPDYVAGLFGDVRQLDLAIGAREWKHLFGHYGLTGLIDLAKQRGNWPDDATETTVADAIVNESLQAGYDPVSGLIGKLREQTGQFEPTALPSVSQWRKSRLDFGFRGEAKSGRSLISSK